MHADAPPAEPQRGSEADLWQALGWQPQPSQLQQFQQLQELLRSWNQRLNLTRLVEGDDYWIAQVFDSLWPLLPLLSAQRQASPADAPAAGATGDWTNPEAASGPGGSGSGAAIPQPGETEATATPASGHASQSSGAGSPAGSGLNVIDVGTGGGFPGLAVAIALPGARLTLVDSVQRKLDAVAAMAAELGLADRVRLRCERVERSGRQSDCRGRFQLAMARAVAAAPVVAEYLVPLLAPGGQALLYRGQWASQDQQELERALKLLNARISDCRQRELPGGRGLRTALRVEAMGACPAAYPRAIGVPAKQPLGLAGGASGADAAPRARGRRPSGRSNV